MTFVLVGLRRSGNSLLQKEPIRNENYHALQALFPICRRLCPARELLWKFRSLGLPPLLFPALQGGQDKRGGLRVHLVWCPGRLPPLPLGLGQVRGGWGGGSVSGYSSVARERASVSSAPSGAGEGEVARSQRTSHARAASSVASPRSSQDGRRRDEPREVSEDRSFARSSRASRSSDQGAGKDRRARSRSDSSCDRGCRSRSRSSYRSRSSGRERRRRSSSRTLSSRERSRSSDRDLQIAPALGACALVLGETGLDPRIDTGLAETALGMTGRGLLTATDRVGSVRVPPLAEELAVTRSPSSFS